MAPGHTREKENTMQIIHINNFEIEDTTFCLEVRAGVLHLTSLHDDDREYHWAVRDTEGGWLVFKGAHARMTLAPMAPESVAAKLLACDRAFRAMLADMGIE